MKGILFDLDGTLVDTLEDIRAALNHVMALCWCREISASECRAVVGNGLRKALVGALWYSRAAYPEDELDILYRELVDFYSANACVHSRVYDGIPELLDEAKGRGCMLGVLSNKADSLVQEIIGRLLPGRFDFVRGLREGERPKPDKKGVEDFIELCKATCGDVTMVGDSEVDWQTARNAGVRPLIVSYGYRSALDLVGQGIGPLASSVEEIGKDLWN